MVHHLPQLVGRYLCQFPIMRVLIHPVIAYLRCIGTVDRINHHIGSVPLPAALHTSNEYPGNIRHVHCLKLAQAVGAIAAVIASVLPKISQYVISQTFICKAVKCHLAQAFPVPLHDDFPGYGIQCLVVLVMVNKELVGHHILAAVQKDAL